MFSPYYPRKSAMGAMPLWAYSCRLVRKRWGFWIKAITDRPTSSVYGRCGSLSGTLDMTFVIASP
jgi:hypothetical protein